VHAVVSLHDALPICPPLGGRCDEGPHQVGQAGRRAASAGERVIGLVAERGQRLAQGRFNTVSIFERDKQRVPARAHGKLLQSVSGCSAKNAHNSSPVLMSVFVSPTAAASIRPTTPGRVCPPPSTTWYCTKPRPAHPPI